MAAIGSTGQLSLVRDWQRVILAALLTIAGNCVMLDIILFVVFVAVVVLAIAVVRQPDAFEVVRSLPIAAPPAEVFAEVNDLRRWQAWSPWAKLDPQANNSFEGPDSGIGAVMRWAGNRKVGEGSMTIIDSQPFRAIHFQLTFLKPVKGSSTAEFTFQAIDHHTHVIWRMYGKNDWVGKAMSLFMNGDQMVGCQFEQGLASLKSLVENR